MRKVLLILWRIWFYALSAFPVILLFVPLAIFLLLPNGYKYLYWVARNIWSPFVLFGMGFRIKRLNTIPHDDKSIILVANHSSYIDIMLMFRMRKRPFVFVGKKEIEKIPIFGYLYKRSAITVDRSSFKSRSKVYERAKEVIRDGYSICVFPERDYLDETILLNQFKIGAFKMAVEHKLPILPIVFYDCKRKFPWYATHGHCGSLRVRALKVIETSKLGYDSIKVLSMKVHQEIERSLLQDPRKQALKAIEIWKKKVF
ncbi:MAG: lysophospholipid acyltransferase family protein [Bacteroidota bacterium]|nr:lysophospholipid acyltransferase family protein [Bacteroidota bacterium]MEC8599844.1 lysophospholipid acyltransferase family protein [Bacteroidota bacterium]